MDRKKGFSLIEVITAITLIAVIMIPVSVILMEYMRAAAYADSLTISANLARREISVVNNLAYTDPTLLDGYDNTTQNYAGYKFDLRRTVNYVAGTNNNLKRVWVRIFPTGATQKLIDVATYVMNVQFGAGSGGSDSGGGDEASFFYIPLLPDGTAEGTLGNRRLFGVPVTNTNTTDNITMTGMIMTSTIEKTVTSIQMGGQDCFGAPVNIVLPPDTPITIMFARNFLMAPDTTYDNADDQRVLFMRSGRRGTDYTLKAVFLFSDGTQSQEYTWQYTGGRS